MLNGKSGIEHHVLSVTTPIMPPEKNTTFENHAAKTGGKISEYPNDNEIE